jgi:hypothetical protein
VLDRARETGLVRIEIGLPAAIDAELSDRLRRAFGLHYAIVITAPNEPDELLRTHLGEMAASLLTEVVTEGDVLGIGWGRTLNSMTAALISLAHCTIVQLTGAIGSADVLENSIEMVRRVADMVVVDATGAVWFDQSGLHLYRLDPGSGKLARFDIDANTKPVVDQGGVYITAIAADGDGVLIARESLPYLTRIDAGLHEVAKIQLPNSYAGSNELAVVGDRVAVGGRPDNFALFSRGGEQVATLPVQRWVAVQGPPRLLAAGPSQAAAVAEVVADGVLDVFDATGKIVSTVPLKLDLPVGPFGDMGGFESNARPQTFTTD